MQGHTDKATINARRSLTPGMRALLQRMVDARDFVKVSGHRFDQAEKSQARALMDRRLAEPDTAGWWSATEAGRAALVQP